MTQRLHGTPLIGFGDFFSGYDDVGALPRINLPHRSSSKAKGSSEPSGPPVSSSGKIDPHPTYKPIGKFQQTTGMTTHAAAMKKARGVVTHAATTIGKIQLQLGKKTPAHAAVKLPSGKSLPAGKKILLGATAARVLSPAAKAAVAKHNASAKKAAAATKTLAQHALKLKKHVQDLAKAVVKQKNLAKKMRQKGGAGGVHAHVGALLSDPTVNALLSHPDTCEETAELLGQYISAIGVDAQGLSPGMPGYDPTTENGMPASSSTTGAGTGPDVNGYMPGDPGYDPTTDPSSPQYAAAQGMTTDDSGLDDSTLSDLSDDPADDPTNWPDSSSISADTYLDDMTRYSGIAYNGAKGTPDGYCGSYGLMSHSTDDYHEPRTAKIDGHAHYGYVYGKFDETKIPNGIPWGSGLKSGQWNFVHGRYKIGASGKFHEVTDLPTALADTPNRSTPNGKTIGPLIGNPGMADFKGMRVDGQGNMFWLPQEAPDWLTFPLKQAAAATAQQAAAVQAQADAANKAALAQQQAQEALAQDAANAAAAIAASQQQTQQGQAESDAEAALAQQQQYANQQQQLDTQQQQQAGDIMVQQAQQQQSQLQQYLSANPQAMQAYMAQQTGINPDGSPVVPQDYGSSDDGSSDNSDDGSYDDGSSIPGADMMQDSDGEGYPSDDDILSSADSDSDDSDG